MKHPRVPPTLQATERAPACADCAAWLMGKIEEQFPDVSRPEARAAAIVAARMVRLGSEWVCKVCDTLEDDKGRLVQVMEMFPNREARRAFRLHAGDKRAIASAKGAPVGQVDRDEFRKRGEQIRADEARRRQERADRRRS